MNLHKPRNGSSWICIARAAAISGFHHEVDLFEAALIGLVNQRLDAVAYGPPTGIRSRGLFLYRRQQDMPSVKPLIPDAALTDHRFIVINTGLESTASYRSSDASNVFGYHTRQLRHCREHR